MNPGRNDPCPCGSGKKYKHCHLAADEAPQPGELVWRRVRRAIDGLPNALLDSALDHFGSHGVAEAWEEFWLFDETIPFDSENLQIGVFGSWFIHDWLPDPAATEVPESARTMTAAEAYRQRRGHRLDPLAARYIAACGQAEFSFHEVLSCAPGRGFSLRDILTGETADVLEHAASEVGRVGDILYAKLVPIDGIVVIEGCAPVAIPPVRKPEIIALRRAITRRKQPALSGNALLREWDSEIRETYLDITNGALDQTPPRMQNTDGEPLEFRTLHYAIESAEATLDALRDLAGDRSASESAIVVVRDDSGAIVSARLAWTRANDSPAAVAANTILGSITIEGNRLRFETNSAERAERFATLVAERLGARARALPQTIQSVESLMSMHRDAPMPDARADAGQAALAEQPEVRAAIEHMLRKHYRNWIDEKIPALGNRTPRKAVKTADGREAVEALIAQFEREGAKLSPPVDPAIVAEIRRTLGLRAD